METRDTVSRESAGSSPERSPGSGVPGRVPIDRFEMRQQWLERSEEEQAEATAELYEKAVRQRLPAAPPDPAEPSEELEAISQELKLRQKCQDIAALIMADEQGLMEGTDKDE